MLMPYSDEAIMYSDAFDASHKLMSYIKWLTNVIAKPVSFH